jgi:hypothetical protein
MFAQPFFGQRLGRPLQILGRPVQRQGPQLGQGDPCPGVQEMPYEAWQAKVQQELADWTAGGKKTTAGVPVYAIFPDGSKQLHQYCYWPNGESAEVPTNVENGCPVSCQELYDRQNAPPGPSVPAPGPTTPTTVLPPPEAAFQPGCKGLGRARGGFSHGFMGRSPFG